MKDGIKYISKREYDELVRKHKYVSEKEVIKMVNDIMSKGGIAYVKFICQYCGSVQVSSEPNTLHRMGYVCQECGELSTSNSYGIMAAFVKPNLDKVMELFGGER